MKQPKKTLSKVKTYNDSLRLYEQNDKLLKEVRKDPTKYINTLRYVNEKNNNKTILVDDSVDDEFEPINKNIKPVEYVNFSTNIVNPKKGGKNLKTKIAVPKYKKPTGIIDNKNTEIDKVVKRKPLFKTKALPKLNIKDIEYNNNLETNINITPNYIKPKLYKVKESDNVPYGLGDGNIDYTEYEVEDINNISTDKTKNRTIIPVYASGGIIGDPPKRSPIKGKGLSPEQQKEAEEDILFVNNWNANRIVKDKLLPKGYQIPSNQPVILTDLNEDKKEGESIDRGAYDHKTGKIFLDPSFQEEFGIPAHEYTHRFQDKTKLLRPKIYNEYIKKPIEALAPNVETYQSDPNEIHSELMRLRRNANFKPDQTIVPEDVQNVDFNNYNFEAIKDKDTLIELLNSTADNNNTNNITYAAYGGNINPNTNIMKYSKRLPKNKRHIAPSTIIGAAGGVASMIPGVGSVVGAGLGLVSGLMGNNEAKQQQEELERKRQEMVLQQQTLQDGLEFRNYNTTGNAGLQYYAEGGQLLPSSIKGKYLTTGGDLTSLNSRTEVAKGNTHGEKTIDGQYGITLHNGQEPVAEIEDEEVIIDNSKVYSDRLPFNSKQTYADKAKQIAKKAGKIEVKLNKTSDTKSRNGYERQLAGTKMAEEALFAHQEQTKLNEGMQEINKLPVMAGGGSLYDVEDTLILPSGERTKVPSYYSKLRKLGNLTLPNGENTYVPDDVINPKAIGNFNLPNGDKTFIEDIISTPYTRTPKLSNDFNFLSKTNTSSNEVIKDEDPSFISQLAPSLIDNVGNMILQQNTPELSKPIYNKMPNLETSLNINPQLSAINDTVATTSDMLLKNTNSSNVARANIASNKLNGLKAKLGLLGEKENVERGLRNDFAMQRSRVNASNNAMLDQYNMNEFTRKGDIQGRISANLGNISEDIDRVQNRRDYDEYYNDILTADILDDPTGEKIRTVNRNPELFRSTKLKRATAKEAKRKALRSPYNYNNLINSAT